MTHEILKPSFVRTDERGVFVEVLNGYHWESLITGNMNPGAVMGNHYHKETLVFFYVIAGGVSVKTVHVDTGARDAFALYDGEGVMLHTNESHAIHFDVSTQFILLKSLKYDPANPDTVHFEVTDG